MNSSYRNMLRFSILGFLLVTTIILWDLCSFLRNPLIQATEQPVDLVFTQGMSVRQMATTLAQRQLLKRVWYFILLAKLQGVQYDLQAGEYRLTPGVTTPLILLDKMVHGASIRHAFTIVEGWTFAQLLAALQKNPYLKHTLTGLTPSAIMAKLGRAGEVPEGRFAPETYLFSGSYSDAELLKQAYKLMQRWLAAAWQGRAAGLPYHCPYEALIVASMIEKETALEVEKPVIAGVIKRRLVARQRLQIDPTVSYGLGAKYTGKLTPADYLKDTPHNTYTRLGLPPSPIAMPGYGSLVAALHPAAGTQLYYVAKGDGTHEFSTTFAQQVKAVKKFLRK